MRLHFAAAAGTVTYDGRSWDIVDGVADIDRPDACAVFMESHGATLADEAIVAQVSVPAKRADMMRWLKDHGVAASNALSNAKLAELVAEHSAREAKVVAAEANAKPAPIADQPEADQPEAEADKLGEGADADAAAAEKAAEDKADPKPADPAPAA